MKLYFGIDPDLDRIAWSCIDNGRCVDFSSILRRVKVGGVKQMYPFYDAHLMKFMKRVKTTYGQIWLENVFKGPNHKVTMSLCEVQGEIIAAARRAGFEIPMTQRPYQQTWRKGTTGASRRADSAGAELRFAASVVTPELEKKKMSQHETAAICIGMYGFMVDTEVIIVEQKATRVSRRKPKRDE